MNKKKREKRSEGKREKKTEPRKEQSKGKNNVLYVIQVIAASQTHIPAVYKPNEPHFFPLMQWKWQCIHHTQPKHNVHTAKAMQSFVLFNLKMRR